MNGKLNQNNLHYDHQQSLPIKKVTKKKKKNQQQQKNTLKHVFDVEVSIIAGKYSEYVENPMTMITTILQRCSLKFISKNKQQIKWMHCWPDITNYFIPIYMTKHLFIYKENKRLFKMIKSCLSQCIGADVTNITFGPWLLIMSFNIVPILLEYIPTIDILQNVLCPLIGYDELLRIQINIRNVSINQTRFYDEIYSIKNMTIIMKAADNVDNDDNDDDDDDDNTTYFFLKRLEWR